jgi:hypothetical protein
MYEFRLPTFLTGIASFQNPYLISGWFMGSGSGRDRQTSPILNIFNMPVYRSGFPGARFLAFEGEGITWMGQPSRLIEIRRHLPLTSRCYSRLAYLPSPPGPTHFSTCLWQIVISTASPPARMLQAFSLNARYSGPCLAIFFPPFRPSLTAAGSFFFGKIQRV